LLVAAVMLGIVLVILVVLKFMSGQAEMRTARAKVEEEEKPPPPVKLYRAKRTIIPGFIIDKTMIEEKEITQEEYENLARQEENLVKDESPVDYVVRYLIQEGDYIHRDDLWGSKESIGLEAQIPPGRIGYVLAGLTPPNPVSNKLLQVGNRVNIVATYTPNQLAKTIVEDALVVALGRFRGGERPPPPTPPEEDASAEEKAAYEARLAEWQKEQEADNITLAITPEDAERIAVSFKNATFDIVVQSGPQELVSGGGNLPPGEPLPVALRPGLTLDDIAPLKQRDPEAAEKKEEERRKAEMDRRTREAQLEAQRRAAAQERSVPPPPPTLPPAPVERGPTPEEVREMVDRAVEMALKKREKGSEARPVVLPPPTPSPREEEKEKKVIEVFKGREKSEVEYTL